MRLLASDIKKSIAIKKFGKGFCVVVWYHEDYKAEAGKKLNNEIVYKVMAFSKILSREATEMTEKQLKYFTTELKKIPIWGKCICFTGSMKSCMMSLGDKLYRIVKQLQKKPQNF